MATVERKENSAILYHDIWNLCCLSVICSMDFIYLYNTDTSKLRTPELGEETIEFFHVFFHVVAAYTILDTLWILVVPTCVPAAPMSLVIHHILTFLLILVPYNLHQFAWHFAICLVVEFNTVFIILRRNLPLGSLTHSIVNWLFFISTLLLRVAMFPVITVFFVYEYIRYSESLGGDWANIMAITPVAMAALSCMGFQWLYVYLKKLSISKPKAK